MRVESKECCQWRENLELAIQKGDRGTMNECFYGWIAYSKKDGRRLACSNCQETLRGWGEICGIDFANYEAAFQTSQTKIKSGEIKCCELIKLVDLNYPDKSFIREEFLSLKVVFGNRMCYACRVKMEGVLIVLK